MNKHSASHLSKKTMRLIAASIIVFIALAASISCVAFYNSDHQEETIPPCNLSYFVIGEASIGDQVLNISLSDNRSRSILELHYSEGGLIHSSLNISLEFSGYSSYDSFGLLLDNHTTVPSGSEKLNTSRLLTPEDEEDDKATNMHEISSIYYLELDGAEFEFHTHNQQIWRIVCNYTSLISGGSTDRAMAELHLVLDLGMASWRTGIPVEGKPVGPWIYDLVNVSDGSKAALNINCVSPWMAVNSGGYLIPDSDASKVCSVSFIGDHDLNPIYIRFYPSGAMDIAPTNAYDEINQTHIISYVYEGKIGHMSDNNKYVCGTVTLSSTIDSNDPKNGSIQSLSFSYSICTLTYDNQGNIISESTISSEYEALL